MSNKFSFYPLEINLFIREYYKRFFLNLDIVKINNF